MLRNLAMMLFIIPKLVIWPLLWLWRKKKKAKKETEINTQQQTQTNGDESL